MTFTISLTLEYEDMTIEEALKRFTKDASEGGLPVNVEDENENFLGAYLLPEN
jgi:hypothetical protein